MTGAAPWIAGLVLLVGLMAAIVTTTPWQPFGASADGAVSAEPARDFTEAERQAAEEYRGSVRPPAYLGLTVGLAVTVGLGLTPLGARLVAAVARPAGHGWVWQVVLGGLAVLLVVRVSTLPFAAWSEAIRRDYGLSTRDWGGWLADVGRSFGLQAVGTLVALLALVALARALPSWWWAAAAGLAAGLVALVSFVYPLVVEPVFNRFSPMPEGELRASLLELAERDELHVENVLVADASRRTTTLNAYVSGFGATRRIVVYDNLLTRSSDEEIRAVVAHELGHTAEHDVRDGTLLGALGAAAMVCLLAGLLSWRWLLDRSGSTGPADPRALALVLTLAAVAGLASSPVENLVSRRIETRADVHALNLTQDPASVARMYRSLAVTSLADVDPPPPLFWMFASHPTAPQRIAVARTWAEVHDEPVPGNLVADRAGG